MKKWICHKEYSYFDFDLYDISDSNINFILKGNMVRIKSSYLSRMSKGDKAYYKIYNLNSVRPDDRYILISKKMLKKHFLELHIYRKNIIKKLCNS